MINFPVFEKLKVEKYLLYPDRNSEPGIDIDFLKGPTLIAGVNGLGKSTLIHILLRLLTGPYDIPASGQDGDLAETSSSEPAAIYRPNAIFPPRVADGAENATAELVVSFGDTRITIIRRLSDLSLINCEVDGKRKKIGDEEEYQTLITKIVGLGNFLDLLLILRYVVFFMEDRRALVWGQTAQREILRALFVAPKAATKLSKLRTDMLSADSAYRNTRNIHHRQIDRNKTEIRRLSKVSDVRAELTIQASRLNALRDKETKLEVAIAEQDDIRVEARSRSAQAALKRDSAVRELERAKVHYLRTEFKSLEESGLYVLARLMGDDECLVCETKQPGLGHEIGKRLGNNHCPLCNTPRKKPDEPAIDISPERIKELQKDVASSDAQIRESEAQIDQANILRTKLLGQLSEASRDRIETNQKIILLRDNLPSEDREATELEEKNRILQEIIDDEKAVYDKAREEFENALLKSEREVAQAQKAVAEAFSSYAAEFLKEQCQIAFQPVQVKIGQTGGRFTIGLYQLSMTGAAVAGATPRTEPDQVSLSQREFLDLAFRMALITVSSENSAATMLVDTPESSLDFLFATRAGDQLAKFAKEGGDKGNRVIVTSNLANADLIPAFLSGRPREATASSRVVNLLEIAEPTAALKDDRKKYNDFLRQQVERS